MDADKEDIVEDKPRRSTRIRMSLLLLCIPYPSDNQSTVLISAIDYTETIENF